MQVGLIPPIAHLQTAKYTGFHLVLAHLLSDKRYFTFYKERRYEGDYLVLDNGAHELGAARDHVALLRDAATLNAQELVLPDVLFDRRGTIERTRRMLKWLNTKEGIRVYKIAGCPKLMFVPQGSDRAEWAACFVTLLEVIERYWQPEMGVPVLGISKDYDEMRGGLPYLIGHYVEPVRQRITFDTHCLGWPRNLWSLAKTAREYPWIRSTDSARPYVYARDRILLEPGGHVPTYPKRGDHYFSSILGSRELDIANRNCEVFIATANNDLILKD